MLGVNIWFGLIRNIKTKWFKNSKPFYFLLNRIKLMNQLIQQNYLIFIWFRLKSNQMVQKKLKI